jgi:hypothetical protein
MSEEYKAMGFATLVDPEGTFWHITIRDAADSDVLGKLTQLMITTSKRLISAGWRPVHEGSKNVWDPSVVQQKASVPAKASVAQAASTPAPTQGNSGNVGWDTRQSPFAVNKLIIVGTKEKPQVQLWSPNPSLKFSAVMLPSHMAVNLLVGYPISQEYLQKLFDVGETINLTKAWMVHWEPSPKNPVWKDVKRIEIVGVERNEEAAKKLTEKKDKEKAAREEVAEKSPEQEHEEHVHAEAIQDEEGGTHVEPEYSDIPF